MSGRFHGRCINEPSLPKRRFPSVARRLQATPWAGRRRANRLAAASGETNKKTFDTPARIV